jgi:Holliday junction resolvase
MTKRINSRAKGAVGEREFAALLVERKLDARRGQQFHGGPGSPDVVCSDLTNVHFEVKRVQAGNLYVWLKQAIRDADGKLPVVAHRRNGKEWVAIVPMHVLIDLLILREGTLI